MSHTSDYVMSLLIFLSAALSWLLVPVLVSSYADITTEVLVIPACFTILGLIQGWRWGMRVRPTVASWLSSALCLGMTLIVGAGIIEPTDVLFIALMAGAHMAVFIATTALGWVAKRALMHLRASGTDLSHDATDNGFDSNFSHLY